MSDLKLRRLLQKEEFRKSEEERRRRLLEDDIVYSNDAPRPSSHSPHFSGVAVMPALNATTQHKKGEDGPISFSKLSDSTKSSLEGEQKSHPTTVGFMALKLSPSSSVSFSVSHSPAKHTSAKHRKRTSFLDDGSDDEDDLLVHAKRLDARKKAERASPASSFDFPSHVVGPGTAGTLQPSYQAQNVSHLSAEVSAKKRLLGKNNEADDLLERQDGERTTVVQHVTASSSSAASTSTSSMKSDKSATKPVRNPLVLFREQYAVVPGQLPLQTYQTLDDDQLWLDDEDEEVPIQQPRSRKAEPSKSEVDSDRAGYTKSKKRCACGPSVQQRSNRKAARTFTSPVDAMYKDTTENIDVAQLKPDFDAPQFGPFLDLPPFILGEENGAEEHYQVPSSINRYLLQYQRDGIEFMYRKAIQPRAGVILGDDMGLGKTIQTISLLAALFGKSGTGADVTELKRRETFARERFTEIQHERDEALRNGRVDLKNHDTLGQPDLPNWCPVLIIAPSAVLDHWVDDCHKWAHINVAKYAGKSREAAMKSVEDGLTEVLVCGHSQIQDRNSFHSLNTAKVTWKVLVVDEYHCFKNETTIKAVNLRTMTSRHESVMIGLTGTVMQNGPKDLWNLVDIVAKGHFGDYKSFDTDFARPIKLSRAADAADKIVKFGNRQAAELSRRLYEVYLHRTKEEVLGDVLPEKDERIIFCEPSPIQKAIYKHIVEQPDFLLLKHRNAPCDCGVNQKFFLEYSYLRSQKERAEYCRKFSRSIVTRGGCCFRIPRLGRHGDIDPGAVLWRQQHRGDARCDKCPTCTLFAAMNILYKLCSHVALLQVDVPPESLDEDESSRERMKAEKQLERVRQFIPSHLLGQIPGGYFRTSGGLMHDHLKLSGKMEVLDKLLLKIQEQRGKVLVFSTSTQSLDLIENHIGTMGFEYSRMDGQTATKNRKGIADSFRSNPNAFVFLLSTKAMGVGLNLTAANFVIMFDVDWNPASDSQAQDRAYRIGQERDVKVFRLVLRGTIEEQKYLRQVYKTQLQNGTIVDVDDADREEEFRMFRGVEGDSSRKGELFGSENLLKFKDGCFKNYEARMSESKQFGVGVYDVNSLFETVKGLTEDELDAIGDDVDPFVAVALGTVETTGCADGAESENEHELGGVSQAIMDVCEQATCGFLGHDVDLGVADTKHVVPKIEASGLMNEPGAPDSKSQDTDMFPKSYASGETQSPMEIAPVATFVSSTLEPMPMVVKSTPSYETFGGSAPAATVPVLKPRNQIKPQNTRRGATGKTTFSASDLHLPTGTKM